MPTHCLGLKNRFSFVAVKHLDDYIPKRRESAEGRRQISNVAGKVYEALIKNKQAGS